MICSTIGILFRPPTHFSHMSHPTYPISHLLFRPSRTRRRRARCRPRRLRDQARARQPRMALFFPRREGDLARRPLARRDLTRRDLTPIPPPHTLVTRPDFLDTRPYTFHLSIPSSPIPPPRVLRQSLAVSSRSAAVVPRERTVCSPRCSSSRSSRRALRRSCRHASPTHAASSGYHSRSPNRHESTRRRPSARASVLPRW